MDGIRPIAASEGPSPLQGPVAPAGAAAGGRLRFPFRQAPIMRQSFILLGLITPPACPGSCHSADDSFMSRFGRAEGAVALTFFIFMGTAASPASRPILPSRCFCLRCCARSRQPPPPSRSAQPALKCSAASSGPHRPCASLPRHSGPSRGSRATAGGRREPAERLPPFSVLRMRRASSAPLLRSRPPPQACRPICSSFHHFIIRRCDLPAPPPAPISRRLQGRSSARC